MQKILALVIVAAGLGGGLALGVAMRPGDKLQTPGGAAADAGSGGSGGSAAPEGAGGGHGEGAAAAAGAEGEAGSDREYVKVGRQIIIPVVEKGETRALMLFDLAIDVPGSMTERAYSAEPRLRDAFLRELFEMSYTGAFSSTYTDERIVEELRGKLRAAARRLLGDGVSDVLILDIMRQEL